MSDTAKKDFDATIERMFKEAQEKLPEIDRSPLYEAGIEFCMHESDGFKCTKRKGHDGNHCAHSKLGPIIQRW